MSTTKKIDDRFKEELEEIKLQRHLIQLQKQQTFNMIYTRNLQEVVRARIDRPTVAERSATM